MHYFTVVQIYKIILYVLFLIICFHSCLVQLLQAVLLPVFSLVNPVSLWPSHFVLPVLNTKSHLFALSAVVQSTDYLCVRTVTSWSRFVLAVCSIEFLVCYLLGQFHLQYLSVTLL